MAGLSSAHYALTPMSRMKLVGMSRGWWSGLLTWGDVAWWCVSGRVGVVVAGVWWWVIFGHDREETPALVGSRS
mgnify:CR=1 FL=1